MSVGPLLAWICLLGVVKPLVPRVLVAATLNWYQRPGRMSPSLALSSVVWEGSARVVKIHTVPGQSKILTIISLCEHKVWRITVGEWLQAGLEEGLLIFERAKYSYSFILSVSFFLVHISPPFAVCIQNIGRGFVSCSLWSLKNVYWYFSVFCVPTFWLKIVIWLNVSSTIGLNIFITTVKINAVVFT